MFFRDRYLQFKQRVHLHLHPELKLRKTDPVFDLLFSDKQKFVYCVVSKNGCSSILSSILKYDFHFDNADGGKIWLRYPELKPFDKDFRVMFDNLTVDDLQRFRDYTVFMIVRDPFDRMLSFINNTYKEREYNYLFDKSLTRNEYVENVLDLYPYMIKYDRADKKYDKHAIPQRVYYQKYKELFGDRLILVNIKDMPQFYKSLTGNDLILNNVAQESEKICSISNLSVKHSKRINKYLAKYEFYIDDEYTQYFNQ